MLLKELRDIHGRDILPNESEVLCGRQQDTCAGSSGGHERGAKQAAMAIEVEGPVCPQVGVVKEG